MQLYPQSVIFTLKECLPIIAPFPSKAYLENAIKMVYFVIR